MAAASSSSALWSVLSSMMGPLALLLLLASLVFAYVAFRAVLYMTFTIALPEALYDRFASMASFYALAVLCGCACYVLACVCRPPRLPPAPDFTLGTSTLLFAPGGGGGGGALGGGGPFALLAPWSSAGWSPPFLASSDSGTADSSTSSSASSTSSTSSSDGRTNNDAATPAAAATTTTAGNSDAATGTASSGHGERVGSGDGDGVPSDGSGGGDHVLWLLLYATPPTLLVASIGVLVHHKLFYVANRNVVNTARGTRRVIPVRFDPVAVD